MEKRYSYLRTWIIHEATSDPLHLSPTLPKRRRIRFARLICLVHGHKLPEDRISCPRCGEWFPKMPWTIRMLRFPGPHGWLDAWKLSVRRRRQNTSYENERRNWVTCCKDCFEEIEEQWADQWADYYSGRL